MFEPITRDLFPTFNINIFFCVFFTFFVFVVFVFSSLLSCVSHFYSISISIALRQNQNGNKKKKGEKKKMERVGSIFSSKPSSCYSQLNLSERLCFQTTFNQTARVAFFFLLLHFGRQFVNQAHRSCVSYSKQE